jgi:hypothetical protein
MLQLSTEKGVIHTLDDWLKCAPPKGGKRHWVDGRSAKELARVWCRDAVPDEITGLLSTRPETRELVNFAGRPERRVRIDDLPGEPRNTDLALVATRHGVPVAISVEAKADEGFGRLVSAELALAAQRIAGEKWTNVPSRIQNLARALLPPAQNGLPLLGELRYQLLTATAGALAFAAELKADTAVLIVHVFGGPEPSAGEARDREDLKSFARRLAGDPELEIAPGELLPPITVPGSSFIRSSVALLVGMIRTQI